jgi:hypothetical protein
MKLQQALASLALAGTVALAMPAAPTYADGAASTRNIFLLGGAATYLIIQHNRKVHQKYAEDAQRQAALEQQNSDTTAAFQQEQRAYNEEVAVNQSLQKEVAYQHSVVEQQRAQLASLNVHPDFATQRVAMVSYGWGQL